MYIRPLCFSFSAVGVSSFSVSIFINASPVFATATILEKVCELNFSPF
jgi:hypothetical protein